MRILVLSTWFPYPLSQGSKIRAYHLIQGLARRHEVALLSLEDRPLEQTWLQHMGQVCQTVQVVRHDPFAHSRFKTALGWFSARPSAVLSAHSTEMERQTNRLIAEWNPQRVFAFTFVTAPYALAAAQVPKIVDIDNLMTPMVREDQQGSPHPLRRMRQWLAGEKFLRYERNLYRRFELCLAVSERDRQVATTLTRLPPERLGVVPNGVDLSTPPTTSTEPSADTLIFNGALTYAANFDAMQYFLGQIFPLICDRVPTARLKITGSTRGVPLARLPSDNRVTYTGYLDDIRPEITGAWACVVPLRRGGGTRLKILEAMALGTPVVSTPKGAEGLEVEAGKHLLIADTPAEFAAQTVRLLRDPSLRRALAEQARRLVADKYDWTKIGQHLCELVEQL